VALLDIPIQPPRDDVAVPGVDDGVHRLVDKIALDGHDLHGRHPLTVRYPVGMTRAPLPNMVLSALLFVSFAVDAAAQALTPADKATMLSLLNKARAAASPPAAAMPPLVWDARLETIAQTWVNSCTDIAQPVGLLDHNPNRSKGYPVYVGENIAGSSGLITPAKAVELWMSEAANYDFTSDRCTGACGHYKQVVNAATTAVGCARSSCPHLQFSSTLVCNFAPGAGPGRPYTPARN
jgi:cysteine-rich secretory family protein